ncbi:MAG TPA: glycosyltransferase family 87 protein [Terracidiphilus sp.]|nr:glycosyltransferase family 87 protein [Terracidiphilus sp.]
MSRTKRILVLLVCVGFSAFLSYAIRQRSPKSILMCDFGSIYYGARCAHQHQDPYAPNTVASVLTGELASNGWQIPNDPGRAATARTILTVNVNLPTTLFLLAPISFIPWTVAQNLWMILLAGLLGFAAFLIWDLGAELAPDLWLLLAGFILINCEGMLLDGNSAALAVSLCIVASWCFLKHRAETAGAVLLALSLLVKPHDSGLVWLFFLLAGGVLRKRALQTAGVAAALAVCTAIWIAPLSPHWPTELHNNLTAVSVPGGTSDPSLSGATNSGAGQIVDLQAVLSILWNHPRFYNLTTWLIVGALILIWSLATLFRRTSPQRALFALASISALSVLPIYHRSNDAKLLLLAIPACALLWSGKGATRWIALALTSASIFFTSDMPLAVLGVMTQNIRISASTLTGKLAIILLHRQAPILLLATGCFYLWIYLRHATPADSPAQTRPRTNALAADAAT